ncbi:MAG: hypothetical protein CMM54_05460 [Rhodospirillaceae bacterium]|nr:hypothetical protein [Rhodospirillaceae bacterium]
MARGKQRKKVFSTNRYAYVWHKRIGLVASFLVVVLSLSGVALMHSDQLLLDQHNMKNRWVLDWYGLDPESDPLTYRVGTGWISWLEGSLYFNGNLLAENVAEPRGTTIHNNLIIVANASDLYLFTKNGELVEHIRGLELPGEILAMDTGPNGHLLALTSEGSFQSDFEILNWYPTELTVEPAPPRPTPADIEEAILDNYRGHGLPWSRVLLDVHTGRILGNWGPYLMDAAALCLLILAGSGIYNWIRNRRK